MRWGELRIDATGLHHVTPTVRAVVAADGRYAACGVPAGFTVLAQAVAGVTASPTAASGAVDLLIDATDIVVNRDFLVADAGELTQSSDAVSRSTARLAGRVHRPNASPLAGARVVVRGDDTAIGSTGTDSTGAFALDGLPGGTHEIDVLAIGFTPTHATADLRPHGVDILDVVVGARAATLASVNVYAAHPRAASEFADRARRGGFGQFVTADPIERFGARNIGDALRMTAGLRTGGTSPTGQPQLVGRGGCVPAFYLNGFPVDSGATQIDDMVRPQEVGGIEVYSDAMTAPVEYSGGSCASIIWTKGALS